MGMEIAISGASGLLGSSLSTSLRAEGHRPIALVRRRPTAGADEIAWQPSAGTIDATALTGIDGVIHLAGAGIGDRRWTSRYKRLLVDSRVQGTGLLATTVAGMNRPPSVFVSASAVGFYGSRGGEQLTEASERGRGFLADLVADWEAAAAPAVDAGIRTVFARSGVVLARGGGALARQLPLFRLGLGGRFGSGTQWLSWVSITDAVRAIGHLVDSTRHGPVNLTAPNPVTNLEFTKSLGAALGRPTVLPIPLFGPRLLFGREMVEEMIMASQRTIPAALLADGFTFSHPTIDRALSAILTD